jgi:hypothetical protein
LSAITLFLGFHTLGLYVHNDVMQAFGTPEFEISIAPVFAQWLRVAYEPTSGLLTSVLWRCPSASCYRAGVTYYRARLTQGCSEWPLGRGGTCDISAWDGFYWHWKHITLLTNNLTLWTESSTYLMGWLRD